MLNLLLVNCRIVSVVEGIVLEWPIEASTIIRRQGQSLSQTVHQIRVTDEVTTEKKSIILSRLNNIPGVLVIKTSC